MNQYSTFTSESVSNGHPDKIADQISDAILDAILEQDKNARVACETLVKTGMVMIAGEVTTTAWVDVEDIARTTIKKIGYNSSHMGFDYESCAVINSIGKQSPDIAQGVDRTESINQGAGDQGLMFGFACNETEQFMPAPIYYAHRLMQKHEQVRNEKVTFLLPDAKTQLTFVYDINGNVDYIDTIVVSSQHTPDVLQKNLTEAIIEEIIQPTIPKHWINQKTKYLINPTGKFIIGGPMGDCGLTGRKIIVDTYGGMARHGGGAFSGKDPSKVDRSAAYAARYVAKNLVAAGIADKLEIQISYAIGVAEPTSISVNTFNTGKMSDENIVKMVRDNFNLTPYGLNQMLNLLAVKYQPSSCYGHFGRTSSADCFTWEKLDKAEKLVIR